MCELQMLRSAEKIRKMPKKEIIVEKDLKIITKLLFVVTGEFSGFVRSLSQLFVFACCSFCLRACLLVHLSAGLLVPLSAYLSACRSICLFIVM